MGLSLTILTDIVHMGVFYPLSASPLGSSDVFRFSASMAVLSLLLKPVSCFFVYQMYRERGGDYNLHFGEHRGRGRRRSHDLHAYATRVGVSVTLVEFYILGNIVCGGWSDKQPSSTHSPHTRVSTSDSITPR